ncbi:putative F-box protein At1g32420 [Bidens hawaiensis]|uniref:putative F-box protein At1g32420 n=1 Tax=Bidens hawaiensis TaxID=980011 RepID=UPI00404B7197
MSDRVIPHKIQKLIMKWLPVRSLMRFRTVSKEWKSHIDSPEFVTQYTGLHQHIFLTYDHPSDYQARFVTMLDDDHTFPLNSVYLSPPPRFLVNPHEYYHIIGCSHGLLCFYAYSRRGGSAIIWNPAAQRAFNVDVPMVANWGAYSTTLGFGVSGTDPKIVKINFLDWFDQLQSPSIILYQVQVFTLSSGHWRTLPIDDLPTSISFRKPDYCDYSVEIDGIIYWLATDRMAVGGGSSNLIISFDMTTEEFGRVNLPDSLVWSQNVLFLSKQGESQVVLLENFKDPNNEAYGVWTMEGGEFTHRYTFDITTPDKVFVTGFRQGGETLLEMTDDRVGNIVVYNRDSGRTRNIPGFELGGVGQSFSMQPYKETLLLYDPPSFTVQDN